MVLTEPVGWSKGAGDPAWVISGSLWTSPRCRVHEKPRNSAQLRYIPSTPSPPWVIRSVMWRRTCSSSSQLLNSANSRVDVDFKQETAKMAKYQTGLFRKNRGFQPFPLDQYFSVVFNCYIIQIQFCWPITVWGACCVLTTGYFWNRYLFFLASVIWGLRP